MATSPAVDADDGLGVVGDWGQFQQLTLDPVLSAALEQLLARGYHGTSVRDIAGAAGMSPA